MNFTTTLTLHMVPAGGWEKVADPLEEISPFVEDALAIERRMVKGVNLANERKRYHLCCRRIQDAVFRNRDRYRQQILGEEYFRFLRRSYALRPDDFTGKRLFACFFPPHMIQEQIDFLAGLAGEGADPVAELSLRLAFFQAARNEHAGVVEIPRFLSRSDGDEYQESAPPPIHSTGTPAFDEHELSSEQILDMTGILRGRIEKALATGCEVNFSNQPHFIIADLLNEFVYKQSSHDEARAIRVVYLDGSEAEAFPLRCLHRLAACDSGKPVVPLKASLVSMRHLEMDEQVDFAWFRNRKVSSGLSYGETDGYCTTETRKLLSGEQGDLYLDLYQTGLETAVVGFYRGVVLELLRRKDAGITTTLRIVPYYFDRKTAGYLPGATWN